MQGNISDQMRIHTNTQSLSAFLSPQRKDPSLNSLFLPSFGLMISPLMRIQKIYCAGELFFYWPQQSIKSLHKPKQGNTKSIFQKAPSKKMNNNIVSPFLIAVLCLVTN